MTKKPTHVYIARSKCGCCVALTNADNSKYTADHVADFIKDRLTVKLVSWETYKNEVSQEDTFMTCPHQVQTEQLELF